MARPDVSAVISLLRSYNALVVHFSGTPKGAGYNKYPFPDDLNNVLNMGALNGLACSVVMPGDNFYGNTRNAIGSIGVVLGFQEPGSIVNACRGDCGSGADENDNRDANPVENISIDELEDTIANRKIESHNEWVVKNQEIIGIFAAVPLEISIFDYPDFPDDMPESLKEKTWLNKSIGWSELRETFPKSRIFSFSQNGLVELNNNMEFVPISHADVY